MPNSPFVGTYRPNTRPTVVCAPDAVVRFNGESDATTCLQCKKRFDFGKYITAIQVNLSVDSVPGSASVTLSIPAHAVDSFYVAGVPVLCPMMEVEIFSKGYFTVEGVPQMYPIFWGLITEVSESFSSGATTFTVNCADILKWWDICRMNVNPAFTAPAGQEGKSIFGHVFFGTNPYDLIYTLAQMSFGDVIIGTGSLTSLYRENGQKATFNAALGDIMAYWQERFGRIRSNLLLYGVNGVAVRGDSLVDRYRHGGVSQKKPYASAAVRSANGGDQSTQMIFDPTDPSVVAIRTQFMQAGQVNFWQSEYETKLELAVKAKEAAGFEFYMDVTGDIVFKPPFYNLNVIQNKPVSYIQDIDVISWDFSESEAEVVTQIQMQGSYGGSVDYGLPEETVPNTSVTDYHLLRRYGWRPHPYSSEFMGSALLMFYHGLDILDRINSKRHSANVTIPHRPELRLGFPVYLVSREEFWYVSGINHNVQFGGQATTTLTLTAKRGKWTAPKGIGSLNLEGPGPPDDQPVGPKVLAQKKWKLDVGEAAQTPPTITDKTNLTAYEPLELRDPKTGQRLGCPNVVMAYTKPYREESLENFSKKLGVKAPGTDPNVKKQFLDSYTRKSTENLDTFQKEYTDEKVQALIEKHANNRHRFGLNSAGVFSYAIDKSRAINSFLLLPTHNITTSLQGAATSTKFFEGSTAMIRPVSDEYGFEVVGHFRYGRQVSLRDGSLVRQDEDPFNGRAAVQQQVAVSGPLYDAMTAQSQGLVAFNTTYSNPIDAIVKLRVEDISTAATQNPDGTLEFNSPNAKFVDVAPLGSPEQKGYYNSVEASQLSRALTLAELTVGADTGDDADCPCLFDRPGLAFMDVGYTVKTLYGAQGEAAPLPTSNPSEASTEASPVGAIDGTVVGDLSAANRISPVAAKTDFRQVRSKVEAFLFDLYRQIDTPHQIKERDLRGGTA